jgi:putative iron-only hydrogenase system regulator
MDEKTRIALLGIIVEDTSVTEEINRILHEHGRYIVGRMGIPYRSRGVAIISIVLDAPQDVTSALSGKLGMLPHVSVKAVYSKN